MSKEFKFPKKLLNDVNECSNGGFVLFNFDSEGTPKVFSNADSPMCAMALQMYISNWSKTLETVNLEASVEDMIKNEEPPDEPEEF
tara:strand:+ start:2797 stop:3054 length:258 start_codon:yes stop_codon:yes gene_type:complete